MTELPKDTQTLENSVGVKPLEWDAHPSGYLSTYYAEGVAIIAFDNDGLYIDIDYGKTRGFSDIDAAKAYVQNKHNERVTEWLATPSHVPMPVSEPADAQSIAAAALATFDAATLKFDPDTSPQQRRLNAMQVVLDIALAEANKEIEALKHDLSRYVGIAHEYLNDGRS